MMEQKRCEVHNLPGKTIKISTTAASCNQRHTLIHKFNRPSNFGVALVIICNTANAFVITLSFPPYIFHGITTFISKQVFKKLTTFPHFICFRIRLNLYSSCSLRQSCWKKKHHTITFEVPEPPDKTLCNCGFFLSLGFRQFYVLCGLGLKND